MAPKRKLEDSEPQVPVHESRQFQVPGSIPKPSKKPRRFEPPAPRVQIHASSVNAIKKRIRDVSRRLERSETLRPNVRVEDERALAGYEQELAAAEAEKIRQKMITKYHMVRFFGKKQPGFLGSATNSLRTEEGREAIKETSETTTRSHNHRGGRETKVSDACG